MKMTITSKKICIFIAIFCLIFTLNSSLGMLISGTDFFKIDFIKISIRILIAAYFTIRYGDSIITWYEKRNKNNS